MPTVDFPSDIIRADQDPAAPSQHVAIQNFLDGLMNDSLVVFPDQAKYLCNAKLRVILKNGVTFYGHGTTFTRDRVTGIVNSDVQPDRTGGMFHFDRCVEMEVEQLNIKGAAPDRLGEGPDPWPEYNVNREGQHGFECLDVDGMVFDDCRVSHMPGSGVNATGRAGSWSKDILVAAGRYHLLGFQSFQLTSVVGFKAIGDGNGENSSLQCGNCAFSVMDIEPGGNHEVESYGTVRDVLFDGAFAKWAGGKLVSMGGAGPNVGDVVIRNLLSENNLRISMAASPQPHWGAHPGLVFRRGPCTVEDNVSTNIFGSPVALSHNENVDGLYWRRNYNRIATSQARIAVYAKGCTDIDVIENDFPGALQDVLIEP
jgi:hypothetical protein